MTNNKKNLIILVASPLTQAIYERIGADELSSFANVYVIDCLNIIHKHADAISITKANHSNIFIANTLDELKKCFSQIRPNFALDFIGKGSLTRTIQELCHRFQCSYITHHLVPLPGNTLKRNLKIHFIRSPFSVIKRILNYFLNRLKNKSALAPDIALVTGEQSITPWISTSSKIIKTASNSFYDLSRAQINLPHSDLFKKYNNKKFILFIDDCLAHSFDFAIGAFRPIISPEKYQEIICLFFDQIEELTGYPVIIAAHQNGKEIANYHKLFGDRPLYFNSTATLSIMANQAMTHYSSAIHFPILLRKPITLLSFASLEKSAQGCYPKLFSNLLGRPCINIEEFSSLSLNSMLKESIFTDKYDTFVKDYIVSTDSPGKNSFENLGRYIQEST